MKKLLLFTLIVLCVPKVIYSQNFKSSSLKDELFFSKFKNLPVERLYDTANYYLFNNHYDTALFCYNLVISNYLKPTDTTQQIRTANTLNRIGVIYANMNDYRSAYKYYIEALLVCEKYGISTIQYLIYNNLGSIYLWFKKYDIAKPYFSKALELCHDTKNIHLIYSNLGIIALETGEMDSAFYFLNKALNLCKKQNSNYLSPIHTNMASLFQKTKQYDSAYSYYQLSLHESRKNNQIEYEAETLSELGKLFFEIKKLDSAIFYVKLSNTLAAENNILRIMTDNYLTLSKIEESKGNVQNAFNHYKTSSNLKDSVFNTGIFGDINQLQHLYEVSKTHQQIEQLVIEQEIKERTISYQKTIWFITLFVLVIVTFGLLFFYSQKIKLNKAYKILFVKNLEIMELNEHSQEINQKRSKKKMLTDDVQHQLLDRILLIMNDISIICDTKFSVDKLAELVESNQFYVSQVINSALKKNFRTLLNGYRIREAQRLFSEPDATRYTIESVALQVGFKSQSAFRDAFKDITGVNPNFYLRSMQENVMLNC